MACSNSVETCMFFVDDSNIWIEAQKFAASGNSHMPKLKDGDRDPRLRIDVGMLIDTLRRSRRQGASFLYGSRPPPNDSVWKAYEKFQFQTKIYDRAWGKEKEVDNSMATDMSSEATDLKACAKYDEKARVQKENTIFIAITGDRDMIPPIKRVLQCGIRVELWGWKSGISTEYFKLKNQDNLLSVDLLDNIFQQISFTSFRSTRKGRGKQVDPSQTVVLCHVDVPNDICDQLVELGRLFYITVLEEENVIFLEFPRVEDIEPIVLKVRELFVDTMTVLSWPEYASRFNKTAPPLIETSNVFKPLTDNNDEEDPSAQITWKENCQLNNNVASPSSAKTSAGISQETTKDLHEPPSNPPDDGDDSGGWQTVTRSDLGRDHRRARRENQPCDAHIRCRKRGECGYWHSPEERSLFRDLPKQDFRLWKTRKCIKPYCPRARVCPYAHSKQEAWCLHCHHEGHYLDDCQYRREF